MAVAFVAMILWSCDKESITTNTPNNSGTEIDIATGNYIIFLTEANTRATLVESKYITGTFGVYGYQYDFSKSWTGMRAVSEPNVFWNGTESNKSPLKVTEEGGFYTYYADNAAAEDAGQINWSGDRYAFFAYYPYETNSYFTTSPMTMEGSPYLTYKVDKSNAKNHLDVMTGGVSQITGSSNNNAVTFTMEHRLVGCDVSISNVYVYSHTENGVNIDEDVDIEISSLELEFKNLMYDNAKIFLEKNDAVVALNTVPGNSSGNQTASFNIIGANSNSGLTSFTVEPTEVENTVVTEETGTSMTFIPQPYGDGNAALEVTANIVYRMKGKSSGYFERAKVNDEGEYVDANGNEIPTDANGNPTADLYYEGSAERPFRVQKISSFNQPLIEGSRYYVLLTFTSEAVSINIVTAVAWDVIEVEDYEFM